MASVARQGWPAWVVDGKCVEFIGFRPWPNVQIVAARIEEQVAVIGQAWQVMEARYQLIWTGQAAESDFEPLFLLVDEFTDLRANLLQWYETVKAKASPKTKGDPRIPPALELVRRGQIRSSSSSQPRRAWCSPAICPSAPRARPGR